MPYESYRIDERTPLLKREAVLVLPDVVTEYNHDFNCFQGLSLEELLVFKEHPLWQPLRRALFFSYWLIILLSLLAAFILSYMHSNTCSAISSATISKSSSGILQSYMPYNHSAILAL